MGFLRGLALALSLVGAGFAAGQEKMTSVGDFMHLAKDGDHTEAFRAAFADAGQKHHRALYIPAGNYRLSDTIDIRAISTGEIFSHGYAELKMLDPEKDIFVSEHIWQATIRGLYFLGGRNHLALTNNNTDQTNINILNCRFRDASGFAIHLGRKMVSAHVLIDQCAFRTNRQTLHNAADWAKLSNAWITSHPDMRDQAVIENYGLLTLDHVLGVPLVAEGVSRAEAKQRWIDNHGLKLTCRDSRFGGEGGGFPIVYNFRRYTLRFPDSSILLQDNWLYCVNQAAIHCFDVPNRIVMENNTGLVHNTRSLIFQPGIDFADLTSPERRRKIAINIDPTLPTMKTELPAALADSYRGPEYTVLTE